jgi:hypothetical protein
MASNLRLEDVRREILDESTKGYRLTDFGEPRGPEDYGAISSESSVIDIVRQMARSWRAAGSQGVANVLALAQRESEDSYMWAVVVDLVTVLPEPDQDRKALEDIIRNRRAITTTRASLDHKRQDGKVSSIQLEMFTELETEPVGDQHTAIAEST